MTETTAPKTYTAYLPKEKHEQLEKYLTEKGFNFANLPHALFQAKLPHLTVTLYQNNKLFVQGKETPYFLEEYLKEKDFQDRIGTDETGKGSYFGPLVIAGVYIDKARELFLSTQGIKDSKEIKGKDKFSKLAGIIKDTCPWEIVKIMPLKYNQLYQKIGNLNKILAWGHARVIENLLNKVPCGHVIVDQFAQGETLASALMQNGKKINLEQKTQGETDLAVASASIIAQESFLQSLAELSQTYELTIPGRSNNITEIGRELVQKHGKKVLSRVAKIHFKTTDEILSIN